jgi:hypothetical protein
VLGVRPGLDYEGGLFQVVVLVPPASGASQELLLAKDPFDARDWIGAACAPARDPSPWRDGRVLKAGRGAGVRAGAAVRAGARIVGRVLAVHALTSDVGLLGDPGLELSALATVEGRSAPFALGRLVSLGRGRGGAPRFLWQALVPLTVETGEPGEPARARLFTGSGMAGVPRGLYLGDARLPRGPGPHVIELRAPDGAAPGALPGRLEVRRERAGGAPRP